jgi:hypothetical protein
MLREQMEATPPPEWMTPAWRQLIDFENHLIVSVGDFSGSD